MKIQLKGEPTEEANNIGVGDCFRQDGQTFMRTSPIGSAAYIDCVNLASGKLSQVPRTTPVTPINMKVVEV